MNTLKTFFSFNFQNINWRQLKTYDFWFGYDRFVIHVSDKIFLIIGALLVLGGIIALVYVFFAHNEFLEKVAKWKAKVLITIGLLEMLWFVFRYEYVQVFSVRLVAVLLLVIGAFWMYYPVKYFFTRYKVDLAEAERKASREKYLNRK